MFNFVSTALYSLSSSLEYIIEDLFEDAVTGLVITIAVLLMINLIIAGIMASTAQRKGYGDEVHAFAACFFLGIFGALYVIALPDKVVQEQNRKIIMLLQDKDIQKADSSNTNGSDINGSDTDGSNTDVSNV